MPLLLPPGCSCCCCTWREARWAAWHTAAGTTTRPAKQVSLLGVPVQHGLGRGRKLCRGRGSSCSRELGAWAEVGPFVLPGSRLADPRCPASFPLVMQARVSTGGRGGLGLHPPPWVPALPSTQSLLWTSFCSPLAPSCCTVRMQAVPIMPCTAGHASALVLSMLAGWLGRMLA